MSLFTNPQTFAATVLVIFAVALLANWLDGKRIKRRAAHRLHDFDASHGSHPRVGDHHLDGPRVSPPPVGVTPGVRRDLPTPATKRARRR